MSEANPLLILYFTYYFRKKFDETLSNLQFCFLSFDILTFRIQKTHLYLDMTKWKSPFAKPIQAVFSISVILPTNDQKSPEIGINPRKFRYVLFHHF